MIRRLNPTWVIFYGSVPAECDWNVIRITQRQDILKEELKCQNLKKGGVNRRSEGKGGDRPSYFKETEKAVQLRLRVEDFDLEQERSRMMWVPKSQLAEDGRPGQWITDQKAQEFYSRNRSSSQYGATWEDASGKMFSASMTTKEVARFADRQARFAAGKKSYNELVSKAKSLGIKGVRVGMRRATIERKIREHQNKS